MSIGDPTTPKLAKTTENARSPRAFSFCGMVTAATEMPAALPMKAHADEDERVSQRAGAGATGGMASIRLPLKTGAECGLPSGDPPACSTVTA